MLNLEKVYEALADAESEAGKNCILLCDRGAMDISACTYSKHYYINL